MEGKKAKIFLSTFIIIALIIGIVLLIVNNRRKNEYSLKILNYLENKYGSAAEFEIQDINIEEKKIIGDGYYMGTDKTPVAISKSTLVEASVLSKENNIIFTAYFEIDKMSGEEKLFFDDLEDLLVNDKIPKTVLEL